MLRINIPWMLDVVAALDRLDNLQGGQLLSVGWLYLFDARRQLEIVFDQSVYRPLLRVSRQKGNQLHETLSGLIEQSDNQEAQLTDLDSWTVRNQRDQFRTIFLAEVSAVPAYLVTGKENYDVDLLINSGAGMFPATLLTKAPETERDAIEAGKALAFEVATGCGFHMFRITESVVRRYWDEVSGGQQRPSLQTLGNFVAQMEKNKLGDEKIVESIKQMTRLHRNPIVHPEVILTVEEAIGIVGMARSVVGAILAVLPDVPPTTGAPAQQIA